MSRLVTILLVLASCTIAHSAPEANPAEAKLREGLKNTMLQLRSVQAEKAALEAAKAELEQKAQTLTEQNEALTKQLADEKAASEKRVTELTGRVVARGNEVMQVQAELEKWKASQKEAAALAAKKEAERAKVNSEKIVLERKVADQQAKNAKMFEIGSEILGRYEKFGLGTAIAAREPFVGLTRIKLKNMFQELGDRLADQKIKPVKVLRIFAAVASAYVLGAALGITAVGEDGTVLARIGQTELKASELRSALANLDSTARAAVSSDPGLLNQVVRSLLAERLILQQALTKKWDERPDVIEQLDRARQRTIIESYLKSVSEPPASYPSETEVRNAYEANKPALLVPRKYRLAQIFLSLPKDAEKVAVDQAQVRLNEVRKRLLAPESDFAAIARSASDEKISAGNGGEIGWLTETQVQPEIRPKVTGLPKNAVSEPVQLADGWHILKMLEISDAYTPSFESVRKQLEETMRAERAKADRQTFLNALIKENPVAINELALADALPATIRPAAATPAPAPAPTAATPRPFKATFK